MASHDPRAALATTAVPVANVRAGDRISFCDGFPASSEVALAEYAPVSGCIAFRMGTRAPDGSIHLMPTIGWGHRNPGTYSWGDRVYMTADDAATANARPSLFHEIYPDA